MLKTGRDYDLRCQGLRIAPETRREMPIWFHPGVDRSINLAQSKIHATCLRSNHQIRTVGEALDSIERWKRTRGHKTRVHGKGKSVRGKIDHCHCTTCAALRKRGCKEPNQCEQALIGIINKLSDKWNPKRNFMPNPFALTPEEREDNEEAKVEGERVKFDPDYTTYGGTENLCKIFGTYGDEEDTFPLRRGAKTKP
jgi:hypothetical protein